MHHRLDRLDAAFVSAASISLELIRRREVAHQWSKPSVLPKMSVGALSCHLGRQAVRAAELLAVATDAPPLDSADAHYNSAAWVTSTSPDDSANDRSTDDVEAALGVAALIHRASEALDSTRKILATGTAHDVVLIPWQGWSLRRDDFLLTRLLEIVVHTGSRAADAPCSRPTWPVGGDQHADPQGAVAKHIGVLEVGR